MGTDLHTIAQIKKDDQWETVEFRVNGDNRNYSLFAMLAGVRNGIGFAGVNTGSGYEPVAPPRGFPDDFGVDAEGAHRGCWMGDHSFSWLTLKDLLDYDLTKRTKHRGLTDLATYLEWKKSGTRWPAKSCSDISGPGIIKISEQQLKNIKLNDGDKVYVRFELEEMYGENIAMMALLCRLKEIALSSGLQDKPESVRIVFGFDS